MPSCKLAWYAYNRQSSPLSHDAQKRCLYHIKAAFSTMRQDLDPLTAGQRLLDTPPDKVHRLLEAAAASQQPGARAVKDGATVAAGPTREQAAKVDRVLASALAQVCVL